MLKGSEKLLVIKPSSLGDIIHSLPFLNALKETYPELKIHWIVAKGFEEILEGHPLIEKLYLVDKERWKSLKLTNIVNDFNQLRKKLRHQKYDYAVDLQGLLRSGIMTWLSGAKVKVGFREARELSSLFYDLKVSASFENHAVDRYLEVAKFLGTKFNKVKFPLPEPETPRWLSKFEEYAVIIPSARWQSKQWPLPYYVEVINRLPYKFLVTGSKADQSLAQKIEEYSRGKAISVAGKTTLRELISVFKGSLFVLTPDTGTMHLAVASEAKVIALFGPTDPNRTGPYGEGNIVLKSSLPCSPCFRKTCGDQKCMRELTPEQVIEKIKESGLF